MVRGLDQIEMTRPWKKRDRKREKEREKERKITKRYSRELLEVSVDLVIV